MQSGTGTVRSSKIPAIVRQHRSSRVAFVLGLQPSIISNDRRPDTIPYLLDNLRRHPERRAHERGALVHGERQLADDAEVGELHLALRREENVGGYKEAENHGGGHEKTHITLCDGHHLKYPLHDDCPINATRTYSIPGVREKVSMRAHHRLRVQQTLKY